MAVEGGGGLDLRGIDLLEGVVVVAAAVGEVVLVDGSGVKRGLLEGGLEGLYFLGVQIILHYIAVNKLY